MKDLFSVILLHYNQPRYVLSAIDSVLKQNYDNLEIILADDASTDIDLDMLKNIHKFWQKYADEMGLIYKTNYSYLG